MTLTTHIVIAAAVTRSLAQSHPLLGFFTALASHYLADAIPHWDYPMLALPNNTDDEQKLHWGAGKARVFRKRLVRDVRTFAADALLGVMIILLIIRPASHDQWWWVAGAVIGGVLPDFLQGVYLSGAAFLRPLQYFHDWCHTNIKLGPYPLIGIPFQLVIAGIAVYFLLS
ncbi:MAG: hypothetical protein AAB533_01485 [Patescibacteria group bacterium]